VSLPRARQSVQQPVVYLDTGVYLSSKERGVFTLLDYLRLTRFATQCFAFIRIRLLFPARRSLLARHLGEKFCRSALCRYSQLRLFGITGEVPGCPPGLVSVHLPHLQDLPRLSGSFLQQGSSPTSSSSFQAWFLLKISSFLKYTSSLLSRLRAHDFPSLNGLGIDAQKVISLLSVGPFSCLFTGGRIQDVSFLFRPEVIKIYSQPLLIATSK